MNKKLISIVNEIKVKFKMRIACRYYLTVASCLLLSPPCNLRNPAYEMLGWPCRGGFPITSSSRSPPCLQPVAALETATLPLGMR